ncbi:DUF7352 domain-containing protein [Terrabacter terrigena]|uniref:DUF7352 domain-containing protein n=1 Tax=Terrabacter terrigena TaxID=574718 RepID=A0ABW3MZR2_9MICO
MSRTIWKFQAPVQDEFDLNGPAPLNIVHVAPDGPTGLLIWAEVDPNRSQTERHLRVVGTGNPIPNDVTRHIGSVIAPPFVWHLYEATGGA